MMKSLFLHEFGILAMTNIIGCMVLSIYNHLIVKPITLLTFFSKSLRSYIYEFQLHLWLMEPNRVHNVHLPQIQISHFQLKISTSLFLFEHSLYYFFKHKTSFPNEFYILYILCFP